MLLIEIEGGGAPRFRLEFHPRLTVVAGLDSVQRRELAISIANLLRGKARMMRGTVDIGGHPTTLDYDTILSLGLDRLEFDNIANPASFRLSASKAASGGQSYAQPSAPPTATQTQDRGPDDQLNAELSQADARLQAALVLVQRFEQELSRISEPPDEVSLEELRIAERNYSTLRASVDQLRDRLVQAGASKEDVNPDDTLAQMVVLKGNIEARLAQLRNDLEDKPGDENSIAAAMADASGSADLVRDREEFSQVLGRTAGEWSRLNNEIARLSKMSRPPEWLIVQTKDELDEVQARLKALTYQASEGIDVTAPLARARGRLAEVQAAWNEIENGAEGQLAAVIERQDSLYQHVNTLLGRDVPREKVLDALAEQHEQLQTQAHPAQKLVELLADAGVEATLQDAPQRATEFLARRQMLHQARPENQRAMAAAMVDLRDLNRNIEEMKQRLANPEPIVDTGDDLQAQFDKATADAKAAQARLADLRHARAVFDQYDSSAADALRTQLERAHGEAAAAQQRYESLAAHVQSLAINASEQPPDVANFETGEEAEAAIPVNPWWLGGSVAEEPIVETRDVEMYLLARAASLRMQVAGESLPLVVDSMFEDAPPDVVTRTLESLAKISPVVQIIYLAGEDGSEKWAKRQDIFKAAVTRLERA